MATEGVWVRWFAYDEALTPVPIGELSVPTELTTGGEILLE